ncbi:MAG TPA: TspO/MBR family protein [Sphingomicrobium sp.]
MADAPAGKSWLKYAAVTVPLILGGGFLSGWLSGSGYGNPWFDALDKPFFMPPGWAFPVAWSTLYVMLGFALALILSEPPSPRRRNGLILFFVQLALNFAWSPIFFAGHDITLGKLTIFVMTALAAAAAGQFYRIRPLAGLLMLPYLAWLIFAASLNAAIEGLNPGAGRSLLGF